MNKTRFDFQDINLIPRKCIVDSRNECDTSFTLNNYLFNLPVVPANMECVMNDDIAIKMADAGFFYIHHRFNVNAVEFSRKMRTLKLPVSISLGVNSDSYETLNLMASNNVLPDFVTIDIAHGHSIKMEKLVKWIKSTFPKPPCIIAGNVSTAQAVKDLESWGVDVIKVGIGPGSACTTYVATGFGSRNCQASVVYECSRARQKSTTKIIADGGIKEPGDISKALVLGADLVMIGGMFSALNDSPGNIVTVDGRLYKEFWGSASSFQSGKTNRIEGTKKLMLMKPHGILDEMAYIKECLQSAISYGGGQNLECFKQVDFF